MHIPVLLEEYVEALTIPSFREWVIVEATLGLGGHARHILTKTPDEVRLVGIDRDPRNLVEAKSFLWDFTHRIDLVGGSFADLSEHLQALNIDQIDAIGYDLGVSSHHLDEGDRGFSFRLSGPLDMRFDPTQWRTAADLLRTLSERELFECFRDYGDEPKAYYIAQGIIKARASAAITTTDQLATLIKAVSYDPKSSVRVFQALRILVNEEYAHIERSLRAAVKHLRVGGRLAVITFHSGEDRIVKNLLQKYIDPIRDELTGKNIVDPVLRKVCKKPIVPSEQEIHDNPRARSAKLRILEKVSILWTHPCSY